MGSREISHWLVPWACFPVVVVMLLAFVGCAPQERAVEQPNPDVKVIQGKELRQTITVKVPGHGTEWPWPSPAASGLDRALAGLGPSEAREVRLSMAADAAVLILGDVKIDSGAATVSTQTGSIELLPDGRIRVMDAKGHTKASGRQWMQRAPGPTGPGTGKELSQPTSVGLWLYPGPVANGTDRGLPPCEFGTVTCVADDHGKDIDTDTTKQPIRSEIIGSRCFATLRVTTTSDFKGTIGNWRASGHGWK